MEWVRIGDIGKIITGNTPSKKNLEFYKTKDIPFIGPSDIKNFREVNHLYESEKFISHIARSKARIVPKNSILVTCIGNIGKVGKVEIEEIAFNQQINAIIVEEQDYDVDYLLYALIFNQKRLESISNAPVVPIINKTAFADFKIKIDKSIKNQKYISKCLNFISKLIILKKEQIQAYDDLIESLFFHILNNGNIEKNKLKDFIVTSQNGFSKRGKDSRGKIVLKIPNINYNYLNFENINRIKLDNKDFKKYLLNLGDLLLVRVNGNPNYVGRSTVFDYTLENCCFNDHIIRIKTKDINVRYLSYYINSIYGKNQLLQNIKTSAGQYTISRNGLDNIEILYPKREMQNYFERVFNRVEEEKKKLNSSLKELGDLFDALMQDAFSGNLFKD